MNTTRPFQLDPKTLEELIERMVDATFEDLQSEFMLLPRGAHYVDYHVFQGAYEVLKRQTSGYFDLSTETVWEALREEALSFVVLRSILGVSPPEWADLAQERCRVDIPQKAARSLDVRAREVNTDSGRRDLFSRMRPGQLGHTRARALVEAAVLHIREGAPATGNENTVHRLAKADTQNGLDSLRHAAGHHVPYAVLLYERFLGRPFASHRDSVSELVGNVMENAIEERLFKSGISYRKTLIAERIPGFDQAPDFFIPDEFAPQVVIEAKITGDDGTARDKVARILRLAGMRDDRVRNGQPGFELVACIDGRGFGERRQDMRDMLNATRGKVFTMASLDQLIQETAIAGFLPLRHRDRIDS